MKKALTITLSIFVLLIVAILIYGSYQHFFGDKTIVPPGTKTEVPIVMDRPATPQEVFGNPKNQATPTSQIIFMPTPKEERIFVPIEVPKYLTHIEVRDSLVYRDSLRVDTLQVEREILDFDLLPLEGGVTEKGPDIILHRYDPRENQWMFERYAREYKDAYFTVTGLGVFPGTSFAFQGGGVRRGRYEFWVAPGITTKKEYGVLAGFEIRF